MTNIIVIIILAVVIGSAVLYLIKAKRNGVKCVGCPAGGSCSAAKMKKKKLDGPVIGKKTIEITGMHCEHCAMSVTKALNQIDGVRADVSLSKGRAVISYDREVAEEVLKNTVEKAGCKVSGIS